MNAAIIIPSFNAAQWLPAAIESALAQTQPAAEIIVVDDGSTDVTAEVCARYAKQIQFVQQQNAGVAAARNHGAQLARAEWLLFLDADDCLCKQALEHLSRRAAGGAYGVIYGQTQDVNLRGSSSVRGSAKAEGPPPSAARANFWKSTIATPGAAMIRATLFHDIGGFAPQFDTLADRDLWIRAGMLAAFAFVSATIVEKRAHSANMSEDHNRSRIQAVQVQLAFLKWCESRNLDATSVAATPDEIIDRNLSRALQMRSFEAADWIVEEAARLGHVSSVVERARRYCSMQPLARRVELRVRELFRW